MLAPCTYTQLISSGAGIEHNGYLLTLFSLLQFVGSMFFGRLADM